MDTKSNTLKQEGYDLMGAAFEVYNEQGYGLAEEIYQESLELELQARGIPFQPKPEIITHYKGTPLRKRYVPDLLIGGEIVVELKAVSELLPEHEAQVFNYMRVARIAVGYLINFGHRGTLEWKRFILTPKEGARGLFK